MLMEGRRAVKDHFTADMSSYADAVQNEGRHKPVLSCGLQFSFPVGRTGSESSDSCVYMKDFYSDRAFNLIICVRVNISQLRSVIHVHCWKCISLWEASFAACMKSFHCFQNCWWDLVAHCGPAPGCSASVVTQHLCVCVCVQMSCWTPTTAALTWQM